MKSNSKKTLLALLSLTDIKLDVVRLKDVRVFMGKVSWLWRCEARYGGGSYHELHDSQAEALRAGLRYLRGRRRQELQARAFDEAKRDPRVRRLIERIAEGR